MITLQEARAEFTKKLLDVYQERPQPTQFLQSFFPSAGAPVSRNVSIEVERGNEKVAVDVVRGADGHRNRISKSTQKIFSPPMYDESFDATELDLYDRVLGSQGDLNPVVWANLLSKMADSTQQCQNMITRAKEVQCSQVLFTGIVTTKYGTAIDYKRKAESIVDLTVGSGGGYFNTNSDVFAQFGAGAEFLRVVGKSTESNFIVIMAKNVFAAMLVNTKFTARQNFFSMKLDALNPPQRQAQGMSYQGRVSGDSWTFDIFTYPQYYEDPLSADPDDPDMLPYVPDDYFTMIPANPRFLMAHGLVPQLIDMNRVGQVIQQQEIVMYEWADYRNGAHLFGLKSAPLAVPVAIDQIYTAKALA